MTAKASNFLSSFRKTFTFPPKTIESWFPGHMSSGMKDMQKKLKSVDCIIEVHDARIPISGRNPNFYTRLTAIKPHILVLNKMDLADLSKKDEIVSLLKQQGAPNVLFTECSQHHRSLNKILPMTINLIKNSERYNRSEEFSYNLMIIGVPNCGKSSLINYLRQRHQKKGKANPVGKIAGVTKSVLEKVKIYDDPPIYLLDTPGILTPNIKNVEVGLRLALCANLMDHQIEEEHVADYLLYWLNKQSNFSYVSYLGMEEPRDDIRFILYHIAMMLKMFHVVKTFEGKQVRPNLKSAAIYFIEAFRRGDFGKVMLDSDYLSNSQESAARN